MPTLPYTYQEFLQILERSNDVLEGYYDNENGIFYSDAEKTNAYTGTSGVLYIDLETNISYRYNGTDYVSITLNSAQIQAMIDNAITGAINEAY